MIADLEPLVTSTGTRRRRTREARRRHLIDPNAPRVVRDRRAEDRRLTTVQQWVMSTLAVTALLHVSAGPIVAAMLLGQGTSSSRVGLNIIAGGFGVIAVASAVAIHRRRMFAWWLLLGFLPTFVGLWLTFSS